MNPSNPDNHNEPIMRVVASDDVPRQVVPQNHTHSKSEIEGLVADLNSLSMSIAAKIPLVVNYTAGNLPVIKAGGTIEDSGYKPTDFMPTMTIDQTPTESSDNLVTSGGVKTALDGKASVADVALTSFSREATEQLNIHTLFEDGHTQSTIRLYNIGAEPFALSDFLTARPEDDILFPIGTIPTIDPDQFAIVRIIVKHEGDYDEFYVIYDGIFTY